MRSLLSWTAAASLIFSQSCTQNKFSGEADKAPGPQQAAQTPEVQGQPASTLPPQSIAASTDTTPPSINANQSSNNSVLSTLAEELLKLPGAGANNVVGDGGETPLVFDWNMDSSLDLLHSEEVRRILFDIDGDGTLDFLEWVSPTEAFLAFDRNLNGMIDSGKELFGSATPGRRDESRRHGNGFSALAEYDDNADGVIDQSDKIFSELSVWRDSNANGRTENGELTSIRTTQIRSISLTYDNVPNAQRAIAEFRSTIGQIGSSLTKNGEKMTIYDVNFAVIARQLFASMSVGQRGEK